MSRDLNTMMRSRTAVSSPPPRGATPRKAGDVAPSESPGANGVAGGESGDDAPDEELATDRPSARHAPQGVAAAATKAIPRAAAVWFPVYLACSVGMVLLNKSLSVGVGHPNSVLGLQNGATVAYLGLGGAVGLFDLSVPFRAAQFRPFLAPTVNWVVMLALSLKMLQYNSVATATMFKTLGTLLTCAIEVLYFKVRYSGRAKASLGLLGLGSAIYAGTDVGFSPIGYCFASLQIASWVLQTFVEKVATVDSEQTKAGVTVIRNVLSLPVVCLLINLSGEASTAIPTLLGRRAVWGQVLLSSVCGCGLGLATSALYKYFAPTTVVVANNVGKCLSIVLGCLLFRDTLSALQVLGLATSLTGSFLYGQEEKKRLSPAPGAADASK